MSRIVWIFITLLEHFWLLIGFETRYFLKLCPIFVSPALCFTTKYNLLYIKYLSDAFELHGCAPIFSIVHRRIRSRHLECMLIICIVVQHCKTTNYTFLMSVRLWSLKFGGQKLTGFKGSFYKKLTTVKVILLILYFDKKSFSERLTRFLKLGIQI
jgi:hypothetical protein